MGDASDSRCTGPIVEHVDRLAGVGRDPRVDRMAASGSAGVARFGTGAATFVDCASGVIGVDVCSGANFGTGMVIAVGKDGCENPSDKPPALELDLAGC